MQYFTKLSSHKESCWYTSKWNINCEMLHGCFFKKACVGGHWRNDLAVNNIGCSSRGLTLKSQHPNGNSQTSVTPVLRDLTASSALLRHKAYMCRTDIPTSKTATDIKQKALQLCGKILVQIIKHHLPTIYKKMCLQRTIFMSHKVKITNFSLWNDQLSKQENIYYV